MAPAKGRRRKSDTSQVATSGADSSPSSVSKRQKNLPVRAKDDEPSTEQELAGTPTKGTLITFGDDDDMDAAAAAAALSQKAVPAAVEEIPDSDSDDDAPEAVSTQKAAEDVKKSAQAVQKAAQEQAAVQKRKRQEKDAFFKEQAKERKKAEPAPTAEEQDEDSVAARRQPDLTSGRRRHEKLNIPELLPAEFLADSSSEEEEEDVSSLNPRPKKRKVSGVERRLSRQDRPSRDEKIGSTLYRVAKKTDERMAPKLKKYSSGTREALMKRNRSAVQPRAGFFVKK